MQWLLKGRCCFQFVAANTLRPSGGALLLVAEHLQRPQQHLDRRSLAAEALLAGSSGRQSAVFAGGQPLWTGSELLQLTATVVAAEQLAEFSGRPAATVGAALQAFADGHAARSQAFAA